MTTNGNKPDLCAAKLTFHPFIWVLFRSAILEKAKFVLLIRLSMS